LEEGKDLRKWHENEKEQLGVSYGTVFYSFFPFFPSLSWLGI
jgi:hypothetical protein